ncbi:MAG: PorT family protein [Bacteroidaceae bacterium]|nr:PorT family protein [Bacteroidaceae bacterium]
MKRLLIAAAAMLSFCFADAQVYYLGFQENQFANTVGSSTHTEKAPGFVIGFGKNFEIADGLGIQPALELSLNTRKETTLGTDYKYNNFGVKLPIDINYGFELGSVLKLGAYAGPTFYLGAVSNCKYDDDKYNFYEDDLNRLSIGVNGGIFCDIMDLLRVKVGYDKGLTNMLQDGDDDYKYKQNCWTIAVGYLF